MHTDRFTSRRRRMPARGGQTPLALLWPLRAVGHLFSPAGRQARLAILIYHRVLPRRDPMLPDVVDAQRFDWQMKLLSRQFNVLPLGEACRRLQEGRLPARAACVTFDDGYADNVSLALPVLRRYRLPATFFVACGYLDGGLMWNDRLLEAVRRSADHALDLNRVNLGRLSISTTDERRRAVAQLIAALRHLPPEERERAVDEVVAATGSRLPGRLMMESRHVRELATSGMEIGAHTVSHPILCRLPPEQARSEIVDSRERLQAITDREVRLFAYPNGKPGKDYGAEHVAMVREAGYSAAVTTRWGAALPHDDIFQLPRFTPWDRTSLRFYLRMLDNYRQMQPAVAI